MSPALVGGFFTTSTTWEAPVGKYQIKVIQIFSKFKSYKVFNLYAEHIMRNAGLDEAQAGIKIARRISITSDMQMTPSLWQKAKKN